MRRNSCPNCGHHVITDSRNDKYGIRRLWHQCSNDACQLSGWDMAITKRAFVDGESRKRARESAVVS